MGNSKSKKSQKEPDRFFVREKLKEQRKEEMKKRVVNPNNKRTGMKDQPFAQTPHTPVTTSALVPVRSYDEDAIQRMRNDLYEDSDAFLLNNILLSIQFFENYERETHVIKNNPISEREHAMDAAMVRLHKHVFFADRLQECVQEHVYYQRTREVTEPLLAPRLYIIYDNVEASEPGDTSDYCAVLDAPFYKLRVEDCKESGFIKLKKTEVLESTLSRTTNINNLTKSNSDDSLYTDSEKESNYSDDSPDTSRQDNYSNKIKIKLNESLQGDGPSVSSRLGRKRNNYTKEVQIRTQKNNPSENHKDDIPSKGVDDNQNNDYESIPRKSILKTTRRLSVPTKDIKSRTVLNDKRYISLENIKAEDTETSGYRSNTSSRQAESSETESDYGYSTITDLTTPKKIQLQSNCHVSSGVLPDECWTPVEMRAIDWSEDEDDDDIDSASKHSVSRNLFETHHFLSSIKFMTNFVDNFIVNLGSGLGFSQDSINNALTQGASIYCDTVKNGLKLSYEVYPAFIAAWPNAANQWIIRERKIIQNPRTNFSYQWPTKYMVNKAIGFGCLLIPMGFRPKRGVNPNQELQWKIVFPAAERYLESCLAHSHMRCYLFALTLHKAFMENEVSKIGIDASHIKNHLFWECEDNYAKWPEDRLGETLRMFLSRFYVHFSQSRLPNYFIDHCNDFKSIPQPLLLKLQRRLADILEAPVMHLLHAIDKLKYIKKDFYPTFNCHRLYDILTCKNPLRILNPNIPVYPKYASSDSDDGELKNKNNVWGRAKAHDKQYQWKKERLKQMEERRRANIYNRKQRHSLDEREINKNIILPQRMETERRRLVLEFFIPHFIAMARSSEKFEAIRQAVIYLEHSQRLCMLLRDEPAGDTTANEYLIVIRDKLADCHRKLVNQGGFKLSSRGEKNMNPNIQNKPIRRHRPKYEHIINQDSPNDNSGIPPFTFVDVHDDKTLNQDMKDIEDVGQEESKL